MVKQYKTERSVIEFLLVAGPSSPLDIGVCVLGHPDGRLAWGLLNRLRVEGYVVKTRRGIYRGDPERACAQRELWS